MQLIVLHPVPAFDARRRPQQLVQTCAVQAYGAAIEAQIQAGLHQAATGLTDAGVAALKARHDFERLRGARIVLRDLTRRNAEIASLS